MSKLQRSATTVSVLAEFSHVFCCGLPILAASLSAGSQVGIMGGFFALHEKIHAYELPLIVGSGMLLLLGHILQYVSFRIDCHDHGCAHGDCTPKKYRASKFLLFASLLFALNVIYYFFFSHPTVAIS